MPRLSGTGRNRKDAARVRARMNVPSLGRVVPVAGAAPGIAVLRPAGSGQHLPGRHHPHVILRKLDQRAFVHLAAAARCSAAMLRNPKFNIFRLLRRRRHQLLCICTGKSNGNTYLYCCEQYLHSMESLMPRGQPPLDLSGQRFGRLSAVKLQKKQIGTQGRVVSYWLCDCDCGSSTAVLVTHLTSGKVQSCGCLRNQASSERMRNLAEKTPGWGQNRQTHGLSSTPEYRVWHEMVGRCHRLTSNRYYLYGARGIYVCDRWRYGEDGRTGFECFIQDMGRRPSPNLSVERIDNDGPYAAWNCKWATQKEQMNNTRRSRKSL